MLCYHIKQRCMLAKGRLCVQSRRCSKTAITPAWPPAPTIWPRSSSRFVRHGCALLCDTVANQIFPILPDEAARRLSAGYTFSFWQRVDETHQAVRFCTNVTTDRDDVDALLRDIDRAF